MEYHRTHPESRSGDAVLEVWSTADYIAQLVAKQQFQGAWASRSDQLSFVPDNLKRSHGQPFCVIRRPSVVSIIWYLSADEKCGLDALLETHPEEIRSGEMVFSGREPERAHWVYVLDVQR
jgi:hypothetical protein